MLKPDEPQASLAKLADVDRTLFSKAGMILDEARNHLGRLDYDLAVRRAQEAFKLYLKSLFRFLRMHFPPTHDPKKQIYEVSQAVGFCGITPQ
jgi:HEPN domain-containing protein